SSKLFPFREYSHIAVSKGIVYFKFRYTQVVLSKQCSNPLLCNVKFYFNNHLIVVDQQMRSPPKVRWASFILTFSVMHFFRLFLCCVHLFTRLCGGVLSDMLPSLCSF